MPTVLNQDIQALLDQQLVIEDDKTARQGEYVVAIPDLEELADASLQDRWTVRYKVRLKSRFAWTRGISPSLAFGPDRGDSAPRSCRPFCGRLVCGGGRIRVRQREARARGEWSLARGLRRLRLAVWSLIQQQRHLIPCCSQPFVSVSAENWTWRSEGKLLG